MSRRLAHPEPGSQRKQTPALPWVANPAEAPSTQRGVHSCAGPALGELGTEVGDGHPFVVLQPCEAWILGRVERIERPRG